MRAIAGLTSGALQNPEIATRMRELRSSLGMTQAELAKVLGVTLTKVHSWEKGAQIRPPAEILLKMSKLTRAKEQRHWFIQEAGVELETLKADFHEEIAAEKTNINQDAIATLPLFNAFRLKGNGTIAPRLFDAEQFHISRHLVPHAQSAVGVFVNPEMASVCRILPLNSGDLIIVDRSRRFASEVFTGQDSATPEIAAILFPQLDLSKAFAPQRASLYDSSPKSDLALQPEFPKENMGDETPLQARPKLLLGKLCKQLAGADVEEILPGRQLSRVLFSVAQDKGIPVTDWQDIDDARSIDAKLLLHNATILGVVVGWIKVRREAPR